MHEYCFLDIVICVCSVYSDFGPTSTLSYRKTGLRPYNAYQFRVLASNSYGATLSPWVTSVTQQDSKSQSIIFLSWKTQSLSVCVPACLTVCVCVSVYVWVSGKVFVPVCLSACEIRGVEGVCVCVCVRACVHVCVCAGAFLCVFMCVYGRDVFVSEYGRWEGACRVHCCSEPVKSARLGCRLAQPPPADPDTLAPAVSKSALSV